MLVFGTSGHLIASVKFKRDTLNDRDPMLVAGLITAIKNFSNSLGGREINLIEMTDIKIVILPSMLNKLIFAMIVDYEEEYSNAVGCLEDIRDKIIELYGKHLRGEKITNVANSIKEGIKLVIEGAIAKRSML